MHYLKTFWISLGDPRLALIMSGALIVAFIEYIKQANLISALLCLLLSVYSIKTNWSKLNEIHKS